MLVVTAWLNTKALSAQIGEPAISLRGVVKRYGEIVAVAGLIYLVWNYSEPVLLGIAVAYIGAGVLIRIGGVLRRLFRRPGTSVSQPQ